MSGQAAHERGWEISEVVFGVPLLVALALQVVIPISLRRGSLTPAYVLAGAGSIVAGLALIVLARRELARRGQPADPGRPTTQIVTAGVFSISRNPLYLGVVLFLIGVALVFDLPWVLAMLLPAVVACHYVLIAPEERYLAARFGDEYRGYAATVHRWIGRAR